MFANRKLSYIGGNQAPILCLLGAITALIGCAPVHYIALKPEHASTITSTRVHATIVQDKVIGAIEPSKAGMFLGGGLLSAIVDTAVNSHREGVADELVASIHKELSDLDFREMYFASLQKTLPALRILRTASLTTNKAPPTPELLAAVRAQMKEDTFLSLDTVYRLSPGFHTFTITTTAEISRNGEDKPLYRGTFVYETDPIPGDDPEDVARVWARDHAAALRAAIPEGIDETMKMLILDLGTPPVAPARTQSARGKAPAAKTSGPRTAGASGAPAVNVSASPAPQVVAPESTPTVVASPTAAASPAAAAPEATASLGTTSPTAAASTSPTSAASASPITAAPAAVATPAAASPTAVPASLTTAAAASPTTAAPAPTAGTRAPASALAVAPIPARARSSREIVRRDDGIMYSAPRKAPSADEGTR